MEARRRLYMAAGCRYTWRVQLPPANAKTPRPFRASDHHRRRASLDSKERDAWLTTDSHSWRTCCGGAGFGANARRAGGVRRHGLRRRGGSAAAPGADARRRRRRGKPLLLHGFRHGRFPRAVAGALALSHDQHQASAAGKNGPLLARRLRHRLAQKRAHPQRRIADRDFPRQLHVRYGNHPARPVPRPRHAGLAGQHPESQRHPERELRPRNPRIVFHGRRQLLRAGHQERGARLHRLDRHAAHPRCTRTAATPRRSSSREDDHDDGEKTFLGEIGNFNGDDIVRIIVKQPATARFISRHLYNFFVADEPQVPAWSKVPPQDPPCIEALEQAYFDSRRQPARHAARACSTRRPSRRRGSAR